MWAVVEIGKKQYKLEKGDILEVERLKLDGDQVELDKVLLLWKNRKLQVGTPYLDGVKVIAKLVEEKKTDKVVIYKYKRRKKYRRTQGHRQIKTLLKISEIVSA